jgi:hypothetical protein
MMLEYTMSGRGKEDETAIRSDYESEHETMLRESGIAFDAEAVFGSGVVPGTLSVQTSFPGTSVPGFQVPCLRHWCIE